MLPSEQDGLLQGAQSCPTLCDPVDCSSPGSSVHGILQARILQCGLSLPSPSEMGGGLQTSPSTGTL